MQHATCNIIIKTWLGGMFDIQQVYHDANKFEGYGVLDFQSTATTRTQLFAVSSVPRSHLGLVLVVRS